MKDYLQLIVVIGLLSGKLIAQSLKFESNSLSDGFVPFFPKIEPSTAYGSDREPSTVDSFNSRQSTDNRDDGFRFSNENRNEIQRQYGQQQDPSYNSQPVQQQPSYSSQQQLTGEQANEQRPYYEQRPTYQQRPTFEDNTIPTGPSGPGQNGGYGFYKPQSSTPYYSPYPGNNPNNPYFQNVNYAGSYNKYQQRPYVKKPRPPVSQNSPQNFPASGPPTGPGSYYPGQSYPGYTRPPYSAQPIYASQYGNYQAQQNSNPILNFFNNLIGGGAGGGAYGGRPTRQDGNLIGRLAQAIESITKYDDLQCVPKILCQMIGDPSRRQQLPSFLNQPTMSALFAALPSTSPFLAYTRAALVGVSGGSRNCDSTFSKCPRNEDDILSYLNNHRGGFFRFFNGGSTFGDDDSNQNYQQQNRPQQQQQFGQRPYQQQQQYQQPQGGQQQQQGGLDLAALQTLADTINNSGGINLSNLGSNAGILGGLGSLLASGAGGGGGAASGIGSLLSNINIGGGGGGQQYPGQNAGTFSLLDSGNYGGIFSNLLSGLVGQRYAGKTYSRHQRRSIKETSERSNKNVIADKAPASYDIEEGEKNEEPKVEARIVNNKDVASALLDVDEASFFPGDISRKPKKINSSGDVFVLNFSNNDAPNPLQSGNFFPEDRPLSSRKTKMIFPDRTGTGQLVIDSEYLDRDLSSNKQGVRFGKILSGPKYPSDNSNGQVQFGNDYDRPYRPTTTTSRPYIDFSYTRRPINYYTNNNNEYNNNNSNDYNRYESDRYTSDRYTTPRYENTRYSNSNSNRGEDYNNRVYVTNSQGKTEYYIDGNSGQKKYL